jgi:hypothetical protein
VVYGRARAIAAFRCLKRTPGHCIHTKMKGLLVAALTTVALAGSGSPGKVMSRYKDVARPFVIFAPDAADVRFAQELSELRARTSDLRERQVVVLVALEQNGPKVWRRGLDPQVWPELDPSDQTALRSDFQVHPSSFAVFLIGKDGGVKRTKYGVLGFEELRSTIDQMPMRQDEMKGR